ncbi:ABC transporter substrate-binding protein [Bdellovibrio sp. SKB1291214]|uniref:substrate-binding periplasmic protein n=1 Tax=Bdellovibrio sp. SKB1291214 TaxID=1732569 RepID=UPI0022402330|nr:ABC transporter substrate-binding protein [Bdellovibrio sp. SKB1291214]UYL08103.1 ABC transporter substrate-binding protein [Bdellovibrio sp. SKB1291214]
MFLIQALLVIFTVPSVQAQDSLLPSDTSCEKRYVVAFQDDPPGFFVDGNNKKNGTAYELLMEVVRRLGCKSTEQVTSYLTLRENFIRNKSDIYALTSQDPEMDKVAEFVEMFSFPRMMVVSRKFSSSKDTIPEVLKNPKITVGNVLGGRLFIQESEQVELITAHRLRDFPGPTGVFKALLEGRIQATFSSPAFTNYFITRQSKMDDFRSIPDKSGKVYSGGFYLSKKRLTDAEREKIRKAILEIRADGTLARLYKKYVNEEDLKYYLPQ